MTSSAIVYIGDEVAAAGYRLAGLAVRVPGSGDEAAALREALAHAAFVLISSEVAQRIPQAELQQALARLTPLVMVVPEGGHLPHGMDVAARVRLQLGAGEA